MHPLLQNAKEFVTKNSPAILTAMGAGGAVVTAVMTGKATIKAVQLVETEEEREQRRLKKTEVVKTTWTCYIPAAIMLGSTILCIVSANSVHMKRNAALAGAYLMSETAFKEYKDKVRDTIGEKKEKKITDEIIQDKIYATPPDERTMIETGHGSTLCFDNTSGRYFKSSVEHLKRCENALNEQLLKEYELSLNDIYYEIGLPSIKLGHDLYHDLQKDGLLSLNIGTHMAPTDEPCATISLDVHPKYQYYY